MSIPTHAEMLEMTPEEYDARMTEHAQNNPVSADQVLSTRERSPIKPQDHKPADGTIVTAEYEGETFHIRKGIIGNLSVLDKLQRGLITPALRQVVGDERFEKFLETHPEADAETAGKLLEVLAEASDAKN